MAYDDNVCGTGGWKGPKPGDPDNNLTLSAHTVYGGINVSWSYPLTNPHAIAYVAVFRSTVNDYTQALEIGRVSGSFLYDRLNPTKDTLYYYWIQVTSSNGTVGDRIGPVSATAKPQSAQTLEVLTGLIDNGVLAEDLKTSIAGLTLTNQNLYKEIQDRLLANQQFADAFAQVQAGLEQSMALFVNEVTERKDGDNAIVQQVQILAAANHDNLAAVEQERIARVDADSAMAQDITSLIAKVGDSTAGLVHDVKVVTDKATATAQDVTQLATTVGNSNSGLVHDMQVLSTEVGGIATDITTVESALNGDVATGQVGLITKVGNISSDVTGLNNKMGIVAAEYFVKLQANGLLGGFGLYNDGATVEAGFDVDRFWVGRTNNDKVKPFIIDNDVVYINKARIRDADIDTLKIAGEAVTVPIVSTVPDKQRRGRGEGTMDVVNELYMKVDYAGMAYILMTSAMGFAKNDRYWQFWIRVNGQMLRSIMGRQAESAPVLSCVIPLPVGTHLVEVLWSAHSDVIMGYNDLFMMGVKK